MKQSVGCFTDAKLRELAKDPNVTVYQPTHDIVYAPWPTDRVMKCVDRICEMTKKGDTAEAIKEDDELRQFSEKYTTFFQKLTDVAFVEDPSHVDTLRQIVEVKAKMDKGLIDEERARAASSDIALKSLMKRVPR